MFPEGEDFLALLARTPRWAKSVLPADSEKVLPGREQTDGLVPKGTHELALV